MTSQFPPFEERRKQYSATPQGSGLRRASDLMTSPKPAVNSVNRLWSLHPGDNTTRVFLDATLLLLKASGFSVDTFGSGDAKPPLCSRVGFTYSSEYGDDYDLVAVVKERDCVIGYGAADCAEDRSEIKILDVDQHSRRSRGVMREFDLGGERFSVGVGHIVVVRLMRELSSRATEISVDASNPESQYVFVSLGFRPPADQQGFHDLRWTPLTAAADF